MNLLEAIFHSALAQRLAQNTQATQQGQLAGRDVGTIPVLGGILTGGGQGSGLSPLNFLNTAGMVNEGAANVAKALTGLGLAGTGAVAQSPLLPATQEHRAEGAAALAAFQQPGNPYERAIAANEAGAQGHGFAVGLLNAALNPLNFVGPAGEAGRGLTATRDVFDALGGYTAQHPTMLANAVGHALEAASLTGHAAMLPYQAGFGAVGYGVKGVGRGLLGALRGGAPEAAQSAAPAVATAIDNAIAPTVADQAATSNVDVLRQAATFSDDPAVAKAAREQLAALEAAPAPATPVTPAALRQLADVLEANQGSGPASATDVARLGGLTDRRPLQIAPDAGRLDLATTPYAGATQLPPPRNAVTPVEEAIAKAASYGPLDRPVGLPQTAAPDLAGYAGQTRQQALGQLSSDEIDQLVNLAYPVEQAQANAIAKRQNPLDLADRAIARIQTARPLVARLQQTAPDLAAKIALLPEAATSAVAEPARTALGGDLAGARPPSINAQGYSINEIIARHTPPAPLANVDIPAAPTDPADRAAWQAKYVGQSQAGTDILAAGDKVGASDLTQADLNALSPQERMAALRKLAAVPAPSTPPAELRPDLGPQANDLIAGIEDAVRGGRVDEANYLVANAADYGVPVSRAQQVLNDAADAGGKNAGVEAQRAAIEGSPYAKVFQYFNRDGELKRINPQTGARLTSKAHYAGDQVWNLPDSGYDEVAASALSSPEFQNNQNFGQTSDEFWRNAQSAFRQYQALKKPGAQLGGDLAAGGGGFGIQPLAPAVRAALASRPVLGGLAGATAGGALGLHQGDQPTGGNFWRDVAAGGALGAGAAAVGGSPITRAVGADIAAQVRQDVATGERSLIPKNPTSYVRQARKTGLFTIGRNLTDDMGKLGAAGENPLQYTADVAHMVGQSPTALPAVRAAGADADKIALARWDQLPDRYRQQLSFGMFQKLLGAIGTDYANDATDLGSASVHPLYAMARGVPMGLASKKVLAFGPAAAIAGAGEMGTLSARKAAQQAVLGPADIAARLLPASPLAQREAAAAAPAFLREVAASGQDIAALDPAGKFDPAQITDPALAAKWDAIQQAAADKGGAVSKDVLGDFSSEQGARRLVNSLFPGAVWNIGQAQVLARAAARHPRAALAALDLMHQDYQRHLAEGDPEHAGTWRITDQTPGMGLLARVANGGAAGNYDIPLAYSFSPVGGETMNLPRQLDPYLNPGQKPYDKAKTIAGALGTSPNPLLDMLAYRTGMASQPHGDLLRSTPIAQFLDQYGYAKGLTPLLENPLSTALTPEGAQQDVGTALRLGRFLDPAALRAGAEIVMEQTGKPLTDRSNIDAVAQLHDPTSPLYQQALVRGLGGKAAGAVAGEVIPGGPQATTATAAAVDKAQMDLQRQGIPITRAQLAALQSDPQGARTVLSAQFQARIDAEKVKNPLLATYDAANPGMLATLLLDQWERRNNMLGFLPALLDYRRNIEAETLGLLPPGTLAQKQQTMDLMNQGVLNGAQIGPGVPASYDPQGAYTIRALNQIGR